MNGDPEYAQEFVDIAGGRLGVQIYPEPTGPAGAPVVVIWPAMGVRARYYRPFATALRAAGLAVVVADLRGTGTSTPAPSRADRHGYTELADDVGTVLAALKPQLDGRTRLLLGHSLGGRPRCCTSPCTAPTRWTGWRWSRSESRTGEAIPAGVASACCRTRRGSPPPRRCSGSGRGGASAAGRRVG